MAGERPVGTEDLETDIFGSETALATLPTEGFSDTPSEIPEWVLTQLTTAMDVDACMVINVRGMESGFDSVVVVCVNENGLRTPVKFTPPMLAMLLFMLSKRADPSLISAMAAQIMPMRGFGERGVDVIGIPDNPQLLLPYDQDLEDD